MALQPDIRVDRVLTFIANGYHNAQFIAENLFPTVPVDFGTGKIPKFGKEAFRVYKTERALLAKSNVIRGYMTDLLQYNTMEHDAKSEIDYITIKNSELDVKKRAVTACMDAIMLSNEVKAAQLAFDPATYATTGNTKTFTTGEYLGITTNDPVEIIIEEALNPVRDSIGEYPNNLIMGAGVWQLLRRHPKLKEYLASTSDKIITVEYLAKLLEVDNIFIGRARHTLDDKTYSDVWGNGICAFYKKPPTDVNASIMEPNFGYRLQVKGHPYSDVGEEEGGKIQWVRSTDNFDLKVVGEDAAFFMKNVIDPALF